MVLDSKEAPLAKRLYGEPDKFVWSDFQMTQTRLWIARIIAGGVTVVGGGALQILLWKTPLTNCWDALASHGYLWLLYMLLGLFIAEHILKWMEHWND